MSTQSQASESQRRAAHERDVFGRVAVGVLLLSGSLLAGLLLTASLPPLADEPHHIAEIDLLIAHEWGVVPSLTTLPGYHAIIAGLGTLFGKADLHSLRLYSFAISTLALATLYGLARRTQDGRAIERLLQIVFLPILFPFLFLLYTDVTALLFFALTLLLQGYGRHWWASVAATMMLLVRQNYAVWLAYASLMLAIQAARMGSLEEATKSPRASALGSIVDRDTLRRFVRKSAGYLAVFALFGGFVLWNGGVAIGDRAKHPFPTFHLGNIYFGLFSIFFLLLPLHVANARQILKVGRRPVTILSLAAAAVLILWTFKVDHPYNQPELKWWLHNAVLTFLASSYWTKLAMLGPIAVASLSLSVTPLRESHHFLIYPFAFLSVIPSWQIEPRYYMAPLVLFLLYRVQRSAAFEWLLILYMLLATGLLFVGISKGTYFL